MEREQMEASKTESLAQPLLFSYFSCYLRQHKTIVFFRQEFYETCRILWRDEGVQRTMSRSNEFQVIDSAK